MTKKINCYFIAKMWLFLLKGNNLSVTNNYRCQKSLGINQKFVLQLNFNSSAGTVTKFIIKSSFYYYC